MFKLFFQHLDIPFAISLAFLGCGVLLLWKNKELKKDRFFVTISLILFLTFSNRLIAGWFLERLENKFPAILSVRDITVPLSKINFVIVLGGLSHPSNEWPITSQLGSTMLTRLTEGIRLFRQLPNAQLVLSGGGREEVTDSKMMEALALQLGVDKEKIILEEKSTNTYEEAIYLKNLLQGHSFLLVTSARHMPRAMAIFRKAGLDPIAAPTDHMNINENISGFQLILPRSRVLNLFSELFYEYLGFIKAKWADQI